MARKITPLTLTVAPDQFQRCKEGLLVVAATSSDGSVWTNFRMLDTMTCKPQSCGICSKQHRARDHWYDVWTNSTITAHPMCLLFVAAGTGEPLPLSQNFLALRRIVVPYGAMDVAA